MAKAADRHIPIKDLDGLLRYLTEDLRYSKGVAAYMMNERYSRGQLQLEKQECVRDGEPYGDAVTIDAKFGHLELDRHGRMRVVPRIKLWREARYRIAEHCDVRAIWSPASQPAPDQQLKDKADDGLSAGQSPQESLTTKDWVKGEVERRKKLGNIPKEITGFSRQIHKQMEKAVRAGGVNRLIKPRTIEQHLRMTATLFARKKRSP